MIMNYYRIDSKVQDSDFIQGKSVFCSAALTEAEYSTGKLAEGSKIVILLSNGAKYMGKVLHFDHTLQKGIITGTLELRRDPPANALKHG